MQLILPTNDEDLAKKLFKSEQEVLSLRHQLAHAVLDARTAWNRYADANASRNPAQTELAARTLEKKEISENLDKAVEILTGVGKLVAGASAPPRLTLKDLISRSEAIPRRAAALGRARVRKALVAEGVSPCAIRDMSPEQAIVELCRTPTGQQQHAKISNRNPGLVYAPLPFKGGISVEELIVLLCATPEEYAEFEVARLEVARLGQNEAFNRPTPDDNLLTLIAKASLALLQDAREVLVSSLGEELSNTGSRAGREIVARIDDVLANFLAKELLSNV